MRDTTIARNYAEVLLELGERTGERDAYGAALSELARILDEEPAVAAFLASPKVEPVEKKGVLERALGDRVPTRFLHFVLLVVDKRRQRLLGDIAREYRAALDERLGRLHAEVVLAREPDEQTEREIVTDLSRTFGKTVIPHVRVRPEILGGVIVRFGDRVLDGSLERRLKTLRRRLLEAELPEPVEV